MAAAFGVGAIAGLLLGLAVGPTGAALIGFRLPYLRLSMGSHPVAAAAARLVAPPAKAAIAAATPVQPMAYVSVNPPVLAPAQAPAGKTLAIGVFGDSMADGLWAALYRDFHKSGAVDVLRFARNSTGLARYDYVDVQAQTQAQLAQQHVDIAVVMFGTNDGQGLIQDGKVYAFGTPEWRSAYEARIDALVGLLRAQGATVYWVGLPRMEKPDFDRRAQFLNGIFQTRMAALGVPFIPTVPVTVDSQGHYDAYLTAPGDAHRRLMRAPDGIHMTMAGYLRLAGPLADRLREVVASARPATVPAQSSAPVQPAQSQPSAALSSPPMQAPTPVATGPYLPPPAPMGPVETARQ